MSSQGWFNCWEIVAAVGTAMVIAGLFIEYGLGIFAFLKFWGKREIPESRVKVETPREQKGSALVVFGIAVELLGTTGMFVQSLRVETQHQNEIARLNARNLGLLSREEIDALNDCLKKATPKGDVIVVGGAFESRVANFAAQIRILLSLAGYTVLPVPMTGGILFRLGEGTVVATARNISPVPPRIIGLQGAFKCIGLELPVVPQNPQIQWPTGDEVVVVVNSGPP